MLKEAGWDFDTNVEEEYPVHHMPTDSKEGFVDYILRGRTGKIIAVIEAKKTSVDPRVGRNQAKLYADCIEQYGLRPVIFYTNGFETFIWDDMMYPDRRVSSIFSQDEIQLLIDRRDSRRSISKPVKELPSQTVIIRKKPLDVKTLKREVVKHYLSWQQGVVKHV